MATFAERQLRKYGWEKGQGLGKNSDGLKKAISVSIKNDTIGLGAKKDEWNFAWWDHVFNKTTSAIQIEKDDNGSVQIKKSEQVEQRQQQKQMLYGAFVKSGGASAAEKEPDFSVKVTDEELLIACEGRTARKGARAHQPGKLKRTNHDVVKVALADDSDSETDNDQSRSATPIQQMRAGSTGFATSFSQTKNEISNDDEHSRAGLGSNSNDHADALVISETHSNNVASAKSTKKSKKEKEKSIQDTNKVSKKSKKSKKNKKVDKIAQKMRKLLGSDKNSGKANKDLNKRQKESKIKST